MHTANDLLLILDKDPETVGTLRTVAERLGCDRIEVESVEALREILTARQPTIAMLAVDRMESNPLAVFQALTDYPVRPATFLVGSLNPRVLSSLKRAAESRGLNVVAALSRPLNADSVERMLSTHLSTPPPIPREEIEQALSAPELRLQYQPKFALTPDGLKVRGVEALVRWKHPRRGLLYPRQFLGAVERYELLGALTDFVMTDAARQAGEWRARGLSLEMVINLSPRLVRDRDFPERLVRLLGEYEVAPKNLVLDVNEASSAIDRDLVLDVFTRLRIQGIGLSLDNFGTGWSSLTELYRMPYSEIKVDHSLIADVPTEREATIIVRAIATLAHELDLTVCAAGVENRHTLDFIRECGFDSAQGRLFSGSIQGSEVEEFVRAWPPAGSGATGKWRREPLAPSDTQAVPALQLDTSKRKIQ